jgi:hypothetical protein
MIVSVNKDVEKLRTPLLCCWKFEMVSLLWKIICQYFKLLNMEVLYDPAFPFLRIHPREMET